jgi:hypothetical protein
MAVTVAIVVAVGLPASTSIRMMAMVIFLRAMRELFLFAAGTGYSSHAVTNRGSKSSPEKSSAPAHT